MSEFAEVERAEIAVQFVRVPDGLANIRRAWAEPVPGLESGTLPGGRFLRARLRGEPPAVYERIGPTFDELTRHTKPDRSRPSLEHYRRHDEIDLLLPV
jgi:DNA gyrase inhibitor GyrI